MGQLGSFGRALWAAQCGYLLVHFSICPRVTVPYPISLFSVLMTLYVNFTSYKGVAGSLGDRLELHSCCFGNDYS